MGASGDGGTGGGSFERYPQFDADAHRQDVREGYGFSGDILRITDNFDVLAQLQIDIEQTTAQRLARIISNAVNSHPSVDLAAEEMRARIQVMEELDSWSTALRVANGSYHD